MSCSIDLSGLILVALMWMPSPTMEDKMPRTMTAVADGDDDDDKEEVMALFDFDVFALLFDFDFVSSMVVIRAMSAA